jgi:hypothetical protein
MNNVRCVGPAAKSPIGLVVDSAYGCGWTGERGGWLGHQGWEGVNLTKPCPHCGGQVALIDEDHTTRGTP